MPRKCPFLGVERKQSGGKQTWGLNVGCQGWSGRTGSVARTAAYSQNRKRREISNPEADLQLFAPLANRELFKSRFGKARKMNDLDITCGRSPSGACPC